MPPQERYLRRRGDWLENQYQTEIPKPRVERIRFRIPRGPMSMLEQRVQDRHPRQCSDAVGSAASQLGAQAVALATELNKGWVCRMAKQQRCWRMSPRCE